MRVEFDCYIYITGSNAKLLSGELATYLAGRCVMDIYNLVILKDVVRRNNIRDVDQLERVINYVMADIGHSFSAASLSKYFRGCRQK